MGKSLTEKDFDQVESWIGTGPKTFNLLYSITRDGCDASVFHKKCDNQGPTLTVLYNKEGSVYGGYTGLSWELDAGDRNDNSAFLYQLYYSGLNTHKKYSVKIGQAAICSASHLGPLFGSITAYDVFTFNSIVQKSSSGEYNLNGNMQTYFGINYDTAGISSKKFNNGHIRVTELEVYAVKDVKRKTPALPTPWRKTAEFGTKLTPYTFGDKASIQLYDTRGIAESDTLDLLQCNFILDGHVPDFYDMSPTHLLKCKDAEFRPTPALKNETHCAVLVLDGSTVGAMSKPMLQKLLSYRDLLNRKEIPQAALITKIDKLYEKSAENISNTFLSPAVKDLVDNVADLLQLPRNSILPVKNYEEELESDEHMNILALLAVRQILFFAEDYLENMKVKQNRRGRGKANSGQVDGDVRGSDTA